MEGSQAGSDDEPVWDETAWNETALEETALEETAGDELSNINYYWPGQPDSEDPKYSVEISQLNSGEALPDLASDTQYPANNYNSSYPADSAAHDGDSLRLESSTSLFWRTHAPGLELNSIPIQPNSYQNDYPINGQPFSSPQPLYDSFHDVSLVEGSSVPYNYIRQPVPENQYLYLSPSLPSVQSAPSDVLSAQSAPFSPLAGTNDSTILTSYGTYRRSGPGTERSCGSSQDKPFECNNGCVSRFATRKDLERHQHTHDPQAPEGQKVHGMFHCRCGKRDKRKDNYLRHQKSCKPNTYKHDTFICPCLFENSDKADHVAHIKACPHLQKRRGRPPKA